MKFHSKHEKGITLSEGRTVSTAIFGAICFTERPINPGEHIALKVIDSHTFLSRGRYLDIGVTTIDPKHWDLSVRPARHQDTWCLYTGSGRIYIQGKHAGECEELERKGCNRALQTGDSIGLRITGDRTVSIILNNTEIPDVFSCQLPDTNLWVVIYQFVKKIKIISHETTFDHMDVVTTGLNQFTLGDSTQLLPKPIQPKQTKTTAIAASRAGPSCDYWQTCLRFFQSIGIAEAYIDSNHDMCFCETCLASRNDNLYYKRGVPPKKYALPVGWARFGLGAPRRAEKLDVFSLWHVAFHGTSSRNVESILDTGDLLLPGDSTLDGKELNPPPGHFTEKRKPAGFDIKQVFVSPSIRYAGLPAYARPEIWVDKITRKKYEARVALQLRIKPDSYKVGPETILPAGFKKYVSLDDGISNSELEWSTKNRGATLPTGVLVFLMPE